MHLHNCEHPELLLSLPGAILPPLHQGALRRTPVDSVAADIHTGVTSPGRKLRSPERLKDSDGDDRKGVNDVTQLEVKNKKAPRGRRPRNNKLSARSSARSRGQGVRVCASVTSASLLPSFLRRRRHSETKWQAAAAAAAAGGRCQVAAMNS